MRVGGSTAASYSNGLNRSLAPLPTGLLGVYTLMCSGVLQLTGVDIPNLTSPQNAGKPMRAGFKTHVFEVRSPPGRAPRFQSPLMLARPCALILNLSCVLGSTLTGEDTSISISPAAASPSAASRRALKAREKASMSSSEGEPYRSVDK